MDTIKESLITELSSIYKEFEPISKELESFPKKELPKSDQLEWGSKALKIQELSLKLNITLDLYLKNFDALELPQEILDYYNLREHLISEMKNPNSEDFKKFKEEIDKLNKN